MFFKKKQAAPVVRAAKVIALVDVLIDNKVAVYKDSVFYVYKDLIIGKERKNIIKNLFFYAQLKNFLKPKETLFVKDLETKELIAIHNDKDGTKFL